jgi:hypothetical protein
VAGRRGDAVREVPAAVGVPRAGTELPSLADREDREDRAVHVAGASDWEPPELEGLAYHRSDDPGVAATWFVVFDAPDALDRCALVAEEHEPDSYRGFWTYDPERVAAIVDDVRAVLPASYGPGEPKT